MGYTAEDVEQMIRDLQVHLTGLKARLAELSRMVAEIDFPSDEQPHECPTCELPFKTTGQLIDHRRNVHWEPISLPEEAPL